VEKHGHLTDTFFKKGDRNKEGKKARERKGDKK
jgi:hypothetical protein